MQQVMTRSCMNADTLTEVVRIVFSGGTSWMDRTVLILELGAEAPRTWAPK
jgi:hypothetical protein